MSEPRGDDGGEWWKKNVDRAKVHFSLDENLQEHDHRKRDTNSFPVIAQVYYSVKFLFRPTKKNPEKDEPRV